MKIYVIGAGGLGGYFGGLMAKGGADVTFVARGRHFDALKNQGLTVKSIAGDFEVSPAKAIKAISEIEDPDFVIFAVKTYNTAEVAQALADGVNANTVIISFQNGVNNDIEIKSYVKKGRVFPGVAYVASTLTAPGVITQTGGARRLIFGDRDGKTDESLFKIQKMMTDAGVDAVLSNNITRDLWQKYIFISAFSGVTAICRSPIGKVLADDSARQSYEGCVREAVAVAKSLNIELPPTIFDDVMKTSRGFTPESKSSLLVDVENNRQNEVESLNGTLVRLAKSQNISVPINQMIYAGIKLLA